MKTPIDQPAEWVADSASGHRHRLSPGTPPAAAPTIGHIVARLRARATAAGVRCLALPPISASNLSIIERDIAGLPAELCDLLAVTTGLQFGEHALDFISSLYITETPPAPHSPWRLFPRRLDLGTGSDEGRYIVDLGRPQLPVAPVFGVWPDPPVVRLLSPSIGGFLVGIARTMPALGDGSEWDFAPLGGGYKSKAKLAKLPIGTGLVRPNPAHALSARQVRRLGDPILEAYLSFLPSRTRLIDLREDVAGATFDWSGRWWVEQFHRHPSELIFGLTLSRRWWRPTALILGRPSRRERRRWMAAFRLE